MEYYAADGLPLKIGDIVTRSDNVPENKYAHYLIRGVVQERRFGDIEDCKFVCVVEFTETSNGPFAGNNYPCLMENLVHMEMPNAIPDFENMFCAMLGI